MKYIDYIKQMLQDYYSFVTKRLNFCYKYVTNRRKANNIKNLKAHFNHLKKILNFYFFLILTQDIEYAGLDLAISIT